MAFKARSRTQLEQAFGRSPHLYRALDSTTTDGARQAERLKPQLPGGRDIKITHGVRIGPNGAWEGFVKATGWNWHLPEFGALTWSARPYLRPGVSAALFRRGGRLKET